MITRRRLVIALGLGAFAVPLTSAAQQPAKVWRIGILSIRSRPASLENDYVYRPFLKGLQELGYVEGKNLIIESRFAHGNYERLSSLAAELVRLKVDVIVVVNVPVIRAAQQATKTIPIVMLASSNPIRDGFVASLGRPGGNITGLSNLVSDIGPKSLELLLTAIPKLSSIAVLLNPANTAHQANFKNIQPAAAKAGIKLMPMEAQTLQTIERAFASMVKERAGAVIVITDSLFEEWRRQIVELAIKYRMPSMLPNREWVEAGGLMSYGRNSADNYRHAATYVDKIFKGAKPGDLPVEQVTKLELIVNRKTAKALGLTIRQELLLRADEVIE